MALFQPQVRISPEAEASHTAAIFVAYIQAADIADAAIDNQDLAMIAHVDLNAAAQGANGQKGANTSASGFQFAQETWAQVQ